MKKTTWPTRRELVSTTVVVIVAIFILSVVVGFSDKLLSVLLRALLMRG
jgi:preprotein translocase SecE subunit